jgi:hypothetical protein
MILLVLAVVTATFQPATPTVGDLVTIDFPAPVTLEASPEYEIVSAQGQRVVVRTFSPKPFALSGRMGEQHFRNLVVPMQSVLKPNDDLKPAPLTPPRHVPYPREPWIAIGVAALLAAGAWTLVWWRSRARVEKLIPMLPPDAQFRMTVNALRTRPHPQPWAVLADATRAFLAATRPNLGTELTTSEVLRRCGDPVVADILRQGDLEKFSPRGAAPMDFDAIAMRALELAPEQVEEQAA